VGLDLGLAVSIPDSGHLLAPLHYHPTIHVSVQHASSWLTEQKSDESSPESPRWLLHQGYYEDSRLVVAQTNSNGNILDPVTVTVYKEILDTLEWEKKEGRTMSPVEIIKTPVARRRLLIGTSCQVMSACMGNVIASYYLGPELSTAGITDPVDQLKAVSCSELASSCSSCFQMAEWEC